MLIDRSIQLTEANQREEIDESMHAKGKSGVSKVTPPGQPGKDQGEGEAGRASKPGNPIWPFEQFAEFRSQIAKMRLETVEQDTEARRKPEDKSREQPGHDDVASEDRPVDPGE
jgi:hypothetical protein